MKDNYCESPDFLQSAKTFVYAEKQITSVAHFTQKWVSCIPQILKVIKASRI